MENQSLMQKLSRVLGGSKLSKDEMAAKRRDEAMSKAEDTFVSRIRNSLPANLHGGSIMGLRVWPDPILKEKCVQIGCFDQGLVDLVKDMAHTMYACGGVGLAAPQVGIPMRLFVADIRMAPGAKAAFRVFVNPRIVSSGGEVQMNEACLSMPGLSLHIRRPENITLAYQDEMGLDHETSFSGLAARIILHEIDHLDGVVMMDKASRLAKQLASKKMGKVQKSIARDMKKSRSKATPSKSRR